MHLVNGMGNSPSPGRPTPGVVKQDKSSGGSVDTTKTRSDPQRVRMINGERPIGKQPNTEALCHPPPPPKAKRPSREKMNFIIGKLLSDHFWYTNFWVSEPPLLIIPSPPPFR